MKDTTYNIYMKEAEKALRRYCIIILLMIVVIVSLLGYICTKPNDVQYITSSQESITKPLVEIESEIDAQMKIFTRNYNPSKIRVTTPEKVKEEIDSTTDTEVDIGIDTDTDTEIEVDTLSFEQPIILQTDNVSNRQWLTYQTPYTQDNIDLLARLLNREAGGMNWEGQVYTCSAILNYCIAESTDLYTAAHTENMFAVAPYLDTTYANDMQYEVIDYVLNGGRISNVIYFRTDYYHSFGTPVCAVGGHYFSRPDYWSGEEINPWNI